MLSETHGRRYAVIVNEFGVDSRQCRRGSLRYEQRLHLLHRARLPHPDHRQSAQAQGQVPRRPDRPALADPAPVAQTFFVDEDVRERAKLGSIVTVVRRARDRHSIPGARDAGRRPGGGLARLVGSESEPLAAAPYAGGNDRRSIGFSAISAAKSRPVMSHSTPKLSRRWPGNKTKRARLPST
jgi:hypothetical protein